jgi:hypothetical protein
MLLTIFLFAAPSTQTRAEGIPCWVRCHKPIAVHSAKDLPSALRRSSNSPLNRLDRTTGILTTYLGKMLGIQGWRDYHLSGTVSGAVVQCAGSSDGLYTVDVAIGQLTIQGQTVALVNSTFIRVEVFPWVRENAPLPVKNGDEVCVSGKLMWDGDGFLEIHPRHANEISKDKCH